MKLELFIFTLVLATVWILSGDWQVTYTDGHVGNWPTHGRLAVALVVGMFGFTVLGLLRFTLCDIWRDHKTTQADSACQLPGTPVLTPDGWVTVENLIPGDEVLVAPIEDDAETAAADAEFMAGWEASLRCHTEQKRQTDKIRCPKCGSTRLEN